MLNNARLPKGGGLLLAGIAAFAYYKYSKMSDEQKKNLVGDLKTKGQKLYDEYVPEDIKKMFANKGNTGSNNHFDEGAHYTS